MAGRSSVLALALAFALLFSLLYAAGMAARQQGPTHSGIATEPKISQLQAIETVEDLIIRAEVGADVDEIRLVFFMYNFSSTEYYSGDNTDYVKYRSSLPYGWKLAHVKQQPELLNIPLYFVNATGAVYLVNSTGRSYVKVCDEPAPTCPMGRLATDAARDRLVYFVETAWSPAEQQAYSNFAYHVVDAETGEIVWNTIDREKNRKPMPNVFFGASTIRELYQKRLDPPEKMEVYIPAGASQPNHETPYIPKNTRSTLEIDNRVVWQNMDSVPHTVVSDSGYSDRYGGRFDSGFIQPGATFEYVFVEPGDYPYHCDLHPWMRGSVEVRDGFS